MDGQMLHFTSSRGTFSVAIPEVVEVCPRSEIREMPDPAPGILGVIIKNGEAFTIRSSVGDGGDLILLLRSGRHRIGVVITGVELEGSVRDSRPFSVADVAQGG